VASSDLLSLEDTIISILTLDLIANSHFSQLGLGIDEVRMIRGQGDKDGAPPCLIITCEDWDISGNVNTMMHSSIDSGIVEVVGLLKYSHRDNGHSMIRHFAIAVLEVLKAYKVLTDITYGGDIQGNPSSIRVKDVDAHEHLENVYDDIFRAFQVLYKFWIPHNV
jgi:hypothetical protein